MSYVEDAIYNMDRIKILFRNAIDRMKGCVKAKPPALIYKRNGNDYPDKKFLVGRHDSGMMGCGLFAYVMDFLQFMKYAIDRGFIPIVDMQSLPCPYLEEGEVGKVNAWEFYFEQPCGFSLRDIKSASCVCIADTGHIPLEGDGWLDDSPTFFASADFTKWRRFVKKYLRLNSAASAEVDKAAKRIFGDAYDDVLGVRMRGTDYRRLRPTGHGVQPEVEQVILDAKTTMKEHGLKRLFLATEDEGILNRFREVFGASLLFIDQNYFDYKGGYINDNHPKVIRDKEKYRQGLDYLVNVYIFSRCPYVLASRCCGSFAADLLADDKQVARRYFLGRYSRFGK